MIHRTALLFALTILPSLASAGANWPQWRGPTRDGLSAEPSGCSGGKWSPKKLWEKNVGPGCTSPIIADGKLYVMGFSGPKDGKGADVLYCFDAAAGKELWKQTYPSKYQGRVRTGDLGQYGGPNATPTLDTATGLLYTMGIDGDLRCWNTREKGKLAWALNLYDKYGARQRPDTGRGKRDFGFTTSPLLMGEWVVVEANAKQGMVMAFEKAAGKHVWSSQSKDPAGHSGGPVAMTVDGVPCIASLGLAKLVVMRADKGREGETIGQYTWRTHYACNIPTPAVVEGGLILTAGYNNQRTERLDVTLEGIRGRWSVAGPHAVVSSPVVWKDSVFLVSGRLRRLDLKTGKELWSGGNFGNGSCLVTTDGKLLAFGRGNLALLDAAADGYRELGGVSRVVRGTAYPHVAFAGGLIACKDRDGNLVVFTTRE